VLLPRTPDGREHVAVLQDSLDLVALFDSTAEGWRSGGTTRIPTNCASARAELLAGHATLGSTPHAAVVLPSGHFIVESPRDPTAPCGN